jgi:hypothetical protein
LGKVLLFSLLPRLWDLDISAKKQTKLLGHSAFIRGKNSKTKFLIEDIIWPNAIGFINLQLALRQFHLFWKCWKS